MALSAGTRLGPYEILEPLGAGGMGEVYRARDPRLKREVALKVLPAELASEPERLERFQREAETLAALNHPHIVTIHSVEKADDLHFLTMELVEGKTLTKVIPRGGLPLPRFFRIAIPLSEAVSAAHEKGIVHRDLKSGNVMVTDEDRIKVLDFGLAKLRYEAEVTEDSEAPTVPATDAGRVMGTAPYMSPEQVQGKAVDHRSDVFSLGIMLYEMATGDRPFQGDTSAELASSILRDTPASVTERKANLPRDLGRLIRHCLEKEPKKRFQSVLDLANELEELRQEVDTGEALVSSGAPITAKRADGKRRVWLFGWAVVAAVALVVGYLQTRSPPEPPPAETALAERKMLVVLPFENLGAPEDAYFAAGMTEELTSRLARVSGLGVISRMSAVQYDRTGKTTKQLGDDLGVDFVLEGTVRWDRRAEALGRVRITPQLIRVADDTHMWADSYDRVLDDIFAAQSEIAQEVVEQLGVTLLPEEQKSVEARPTENIEAYNLYLQGRYIRFQWDETTDQLQSAADHFRRATENDPNFALAYAALAECYSYLAWVDEVPGEKAERAVEQALRLDDTLPDAYVALGQIREIHYHDWAGAEEAFKRAIELNPTLWNAHREYGWLLRRMGRYAESLIEMKRVHLLDPVSSLSNSNLAYSYVLMGGFDQAIEVLQKMVELYPELDSLHHWLAVAYAEKGLFDEALDELNQVKPPNRQTRAYLSGAGYIHALVGNSAEALKYIERLESSRRLSASQANRGIAQIYVGLGDYEEAFRRLEKSRYGGVPHVNLNAEHWWAPLRNDPRYIAKLRRIGLQR
jgi:TolB-like protein/Tfp pilus assembly protein PilF